LSVTITSVLVTDFSARVVKTINNQYGASGLTLSADGRTLYVALASGDAVSAIDTKTLTETARYATGAQTCPTHLARTDNAVWFGYGCDESFTGGIGKLDLTTTPPTVHLDQQGDARFQKAPLLTATPDADGPVVAGQAELSLSTIRIYAVASGKLESRAAGNFVGSDLADLALSPDGATVYTASGSRDHIEAFATADLSRAGAYHSGTYPNSVAASSDGKYIAAGVRNPRDDAYLYLTGGAEPQNILNLTDEVLAPRGLIWAEGTKRLFAITRPANGTAPTLKVITFPVH
jgi:YVTN family beta-propeller protein